jgi:hypothetical protein
MDSNTLDVILTARRSAHGDFGDHASVTQALKLVMVGGRNWNSLPAPQRESLEMIQHKIGRILSGDPNHQDHWDDIAGYATLVSRRLPKASA